MNRIREFREKCGLSQKYVALALNVKPPSVSNWESGKTTPTSENALALSKLFGCTVNELMIDEPDTSRVIPYDEAMETLRIVLTDDEREALKLYQGAEPTYQQVAKDVLRAHQREKKETIVQTRSIPVFDSPAAAGTPLYAESSYEYLDFPVSEIPKGTDFGVRISGESMQPTIKDGSIVFVAKTVELRDGEIGVFMLGDSAVCKRLKLDNAERVVALISDNPAYAPIEGYALDGCRVVGRVLDAIC